MMKYDLCASICWSFVVLNYEEAKVEESVSKIKDASPQLSDGPDDFDSPRTDPGKNC